MSIRSFRDFIRGGHRNNVEEEIGIGSHRVLQDFAPPLPKQVSPEEEKKLPHKVFIYSAYRVWLEKIILPSVFDVARCKFPDISKFDRKDFPYLEADTSHAAWAYRWDFQPWADDYNVTEICIWELAQFLDEDPPSNSRKTTQEQVRPVLQYHGQLTPPNSNEQKHKPTADDMKAKERVAYEARCAMLKRKPMEQPPLLDTPNMDLMRELSGGRLERLIGRLAVLPYHSLVLIDHISYIKRPTIILFYFIRLMKGKVRNLRLQNIMAEQPISLVDNVDLTNLDSLAVLQSKKHPAWHDDSIVPIIDKWMDTPIDEKRNISLFFSNVTIKIKKIIMFIMDWHQRREVHMFNKIIFDEGVWTAHELLDFLEDTKCWGGLYSHPNDERPGFGRHDDYRIPINNKQIVFPHRFTDAVIHYSYRDGQFVFQCFPNIKIMKRRVLDARTWRHYIRAHPGERDGEGPPLSRDTIVMRVKPIPELDRSGGLLSAVRSFLFD